MEKRRGSVLFETYDVAVAALVYRAHVLLDIPLPFAGAHTHGTLEFAVADRVRIVTPGDEAKVGLRGERGHVGGRGVGVGRCGPFL